MNSNSSATSVPRICVIIPVYNRPNVLPRTLTAILDQDAPPIRVVLCNDGSSDTTLKKARDWVKQNDPPFEVKILDLPHKGAAAARNAGLKYLLTKGDCDFAYFLDSDDIPPVDFLSRCGAFLVDHPKVVGVCTPRLMRFDERDVFDSFRDFAANPIAWIIKYGAGLLSCSVFRLPAVKAVGGFDESLPTGHDMFFYDQLLDQGPMHALSGAAVLSNRAESKTQDRGNLSIYIPDRFAIGARIREAIIKRRGESRRPYARVVHGLWYQACKRAQQQGKAGPALRSCLKAIRWRPSAWRPYIRLLMICGLAPFFFVRRR